MSDIAVLHHAEIDSTNLEAHRLAEKGNFGPHWIVADQQTAGKGRLDRDWQSPVGNLYTTLVLPLDVEPRAYPQLGFVTALAVRDVAEKLIGSDKAKLKWPNDVLIDGAKLAGILCETIDRPGGAGIAIGCGINVASSPKGLQYPTCALSDFCKTTVKDVFTAYDHALKVRMGQWDFGRGFEQIANNFMHYAIGFGETVTMTMGDDVKTGVMEGLFPDGSLCLNTGGKKFAVYAGDLAIPSLARQRGQHA